MKFFRIIIMVLLILIISICLYGCKRSENETDELTIISTSFPGYDFVRAIVGDSDTIKVEMLLKPGTELHDYEPTTKDIIKLQKSDMFIYVGGDSDEWVNSITRNFNSNTKVLKLVDMVDLKLEEHKEGMDIDTDEVEYDEHVWTSPLNAIEIIKKIEEEIISIDPSNKQLYETNMNNYINELYAIDDSIREIVDNAKRKEIIFADRFPFKYFTDEYNLSYYAAFPGCSEQTEASAKTISFLASKVKSDSIPVVLKLELTNGSIAKIVSEQTGVKILEFNSAHNVSKEDFELGLTYVDIMNKNINVLKEALN